MIFIVNYNILLLKSFETEENGLYSPIVRFPIYSLTLTEHPLVPGVELEAIASLVSRG